MHRMMTPAVIATALLLALPAQAQKDELVIGIGQFPTGFPKWLKGVRPTGHQFPSTLWVEQWTAG